MVELLPAGFFFLCKLVCESALTHMRTSGILPSSDAMEVVKKKRKPCSVWTGADNSIALLLNYCIAYRYQTAEGRETLLPSLLPMNDFCLQICPLALIRPGSRDDAINPLRAVRPCSSGALRSRRNFSTRERRCQKVLAKENVSTLNF